MKRQNCRMMTMLWLDGNHQSCSVLLKCIFHDLLYLVLYALTRLQAGKDLALNGLDPQFPLLICRCFKVPRLTRQRHDDELKGILLLWKTQMNNKLVLEQHACQLWNLTLQISGTDLWSVQANPSSECTMEWASVKLSNTQMIFLAPPLLPWHCCFVWWCLKISNKTRFNSFLLDQIPLKTITITKGQQHTISPFFKSDFCDSASFFTYFLIPKL